MIRMSTRGSYYCENCAVRDRGLCSAISECAAGDLRKAAHHKRMLAGQVLQSEHEESSWLAVIVSGVIKMVKTHKDGRQQIVGLRFPGDLIGRPYPGKPMLVVEATTKLELCCFGRGAFEELMQRHPTMADAVLRRTLDDLDASRDWMFVLGRKNAREKLASLIAGIHARCSGSGPREKDETALIELPLSRTEIADFLGLTLETVSRELKALKTMGLIATRGRRHLEILSLGALGELAEGETILTH